MRRNVIRLVLATFVAGWMLLGTFSAPAGALLTPDEAAAQAKAQAAASTPLTPTQMDQQSAAAAKMADSDISPLEKAAQSGAAPSENNTDLSFNSKSTFTLANGLEFFALLVAVGGILISSALWALGSRGDNIGQEIAGKRGLVLCLTAAFLIGALPAMAAFLANASDAFSK